ncbi:MAG: hypothetical protein ACREMT_02440 [Vulcanimicrobiaceae bacterium]
MAAVAGVGATAGFAPAAPGRENHVPTAVYCCHGYANDTVSPSEAGPYVTWATTDRDGAEADRAAGIRHAVEYIDVGRVYRPDRAYPFVNGGKFAGARAVNCSGQLIATSPEGFMTDPYKAETLDLLDDEIAYNYSSAYAAYFVDDVDSFRWGMQNGPPCRGTPATPWAEPSASIAYAALLASVRVRVGSREVAPKIIINGLNQYADKPAMHAFPLNTLRPANVIGGMCEGCFADNTPDTLKSGAEWQDDLDLEIKTVRMHKIFWDYVRYIANDPKARLYTYASFMLAWDPDYTLYQTAYKPNSAGQLHVTPETQLVAHDPVKRGFDSVDALRDGDGDGTYVREYRNCSYRGQPIGSCAFVVNSDSAAHRAPRLSLEYRHTLTVEGGMVLEGGRASLVGPQMPATIPAMTGFVLTR